MKAKELITKLEELTESHPDTIVMLDTVDGGLAELVTVEFSNEDDLITLGD